jgi:S-adenosylmethionine hydrolase
MSSPAFTEVVSEKSMIIGEVIHVDDFGNVVTNLGSKHLRHIRYGQMIEVRLKTAAVKLRFCRAYGDVSPRRPLALIGSHDFLEISVNQGSARDVFGVEIGSKIRVRVH